MRNILDGSKTKINLHLCSTSIYLFSNSKIISMFHMCFVYAHTHSHEPKCVLKIFYLILFLLCECLFFFFFSLTIEIAFVDRSSSLVYFGEVFFLFFFSPQAKEKSLRLEHNSLHFVFDPVFERQLIFLFIQVCARMKKEIIFTL